MDRNCNPADDSTKQYGFFGFWGDSLAADVLKANGDPFRSKLQAEANGGFDILCRAWAGYTSGQVLYALEDSFPYTKGPKQVFLWVGTNDASFISKDKERTSPEQFETNLTTLIEWFISEQQAKVYVATLLPLNDERYENWRCSEFARKSKEPRRLDEKHRQYSNIIRKVASRKADAGVFLVDIAKKIDQCVCAKSSSLEEILGEDGLHGRQKAYEILWGLMKQPVAKAKELGPNYPDWTLAPELAPQVGMAPPKSQLSKG